MLISKPERKIAVNEQNWNRRQFLGRSLTAASVAAASYQRIHGANGRIGVANVGCGRRNLLREAIQIRTDADIDIKVVCDTWGLKRRRAAEQVKEFTGAEPRQVINFQEILAMKDVDAVIIGTPDHLHAKMLAEAARAGKHVYVEKPIAMNMRELIEAYDAVKKHKVVVQVGTQMRSYPQSLAAKEFLAAGKLGKILKVEQARNGFSPYWQSYGGNEFFKDTPTDDDVAWKLFLGDRRDRPFNPQQYLGWYGYREFSRGPHTNLMVHFIDIVHYVTGASIPKRVVAMGGTYRWQGEFTAPDSVEVSLEYPEDFLVRYCTTFGNSAGSCARWYGTLGTLDAKNLSSREPWTASGQGSSEPDKLSEAMDLPMPQRVQHMKNWIDSIRSGEEPVAPIDAGYAHGVAVIMADEALVSGRRQVYDPARREVKAG
jgi:predicted dehydrogenase